MATLLQLYQIIMIFQRNGSPDLHWKVYDERSLLKSNITTIESCIRKVCKSKYATLR